jgi:VWFA-related protein
MKKLIPIILLIFVFSVFGQKDKDKVEVKPIEIKANLLIIDSKQNLANDIKQEDLKVFEAGVEQKITYFQKKSSTKVGFVIDNSGSLRSQLETVIKISSTIADYLRESEESFVVRFISNDKIEIIQDWTNDKIRLKRAFESMFTEGGSSAVLDALYLAVEKFADKNKDSNNRNVLILISDCEDRDSYYNSKKVIDLLQKNNVQVYVIGLIKALQSSEKKVREFVHLLSSSTNGSAFFPEYSNKKPEKIVDAIKNILQEIQAQYEIGYVSNNQNRKISERKLVVEVANDAKGEKRQVFVRDKVLIPKE